MASEFTDEQVGKRVVAQSGATIGTVSSVRDGDIYVELTGDVENGLLSELGWGGAVNQEQLKLQDEYVSTVTDETIRLRT